MINISRNKQTILYIIILIFGIFFFFYFYRQAMDAESDVSQIESNSQAKPVITNFNVNIDLNLFKSEKFRSLGSDVAPAQNFQTGKRNPFQPN